MQQLCNFVTPRRRERHAKTIDIAQEEVLTCLGIHLYERLHRIWQKLRAEEQTWQMLFYLGVDALRKSFEVKNQGLCFLLACRKGIKRYGVDPVEYQARNGMICIEQM